MKTTQVLLFCLISFNLLGQTQTPVRLTDVNPGEGHSYPETWFEFNDRVYFEAVAADNGSKGLYCYDGNNTVFLYSMDVGVTPNYIRRYHCATLENKAVFWANSLDTQMGLFSVDTMNNVVLEEPHYGEYSMSDYGPMVSTEDYVFYSSRDENDSMSFKVFDGYEINKLLTLANFSWKIGVLRDTVYFYIAEAGEDKYSLYRYDGQNVSAVTTDGITKQSLYHVAEIFSGKDHLYVLGMENEDPGYNDHAFVLKNDSLVKLLVPEYPDGFMTEVSGIVGDSLYVGIYNQATLLFTPDEGRIVSQVISAQDSYSHTPFVRIGNEIVFSGKMGSTVGTELFAYNTANDSSYLLHDYVPGYNSGEPRELSESEGVVYFSVVSSGQSMVGTYDGMNFINYDANPEPNSGCNPYNFYAGSKGVFFTQYDGPGGFGFEVYTSDYYLFTPDEFKENNPDTWVVAYPNPTDGLIHISFKNYLEEVTISLKDLHGKVLSSRIFYKTSVINYEIVEPAGIYLLEFNTPDGLNTNIKVLKR